MKWAAPSADHGGISLSSPEPLQVFKQAQSWYDLYSEVGEVPASDAVLCLGATTQHFHLDWSVDDSGAI